jgi:hypothetical protein
MSSFPLHAQSAEDNDVPTPFAYGMEASETNEQESDVEGDVDSLAWVQSTAALAATGFISGAATPDAAPPSTASAAIPAPPKDDGASLRMAGYVAGGVGIAGFVLFAVAGIGAKNAHDRLYEDCNAGRCNDASHESDIEKGKMLQTVANIGLATGLTGLGLGATLIVLGSQPASDNTASVGMPGRGGLFTLRGRF